MIDGSGLSVALLTYSTKPRGGVVHTLALAEALARLGAEVCVWTLGRGGDQAFYREVDPAVRLEVVEFPPIEGEGVGPRIMRSIATMAEAFQARGASYDVVHAQDCISANAVPGCVRTIHHLDQFTTPELAACHERAVTEPIARVCVSQSVAEEVRQGWGLNPTVIPNGVDFARFDAAAADSRGVAAWRSRLGRYVLAVGGIEPRKGSIDLVRAFAIARRTDPSLRLVFAGGETLFDYRDYRDAFDAECRALDVEPTILGTVPEADMAGLVAGAHRFSFVSTKEGFGLAAMEALAGGVPVVVRDLPVLREVFGTAARFATDPAQIADALLMPVDDEHSKAGRRLARSHSWESAARRHLDFYREVLNTNLGAA